MLPNANHSQGSLRSPAEAGLIKHILIRNGDNYVDC